MIKKINGLEGNKFQKYINDMHKEYLNGLDKIKNKLYFQEAIDSKNDFEFVKKSLYDSMIILYKTIIENEKKISENMKIYLNLIKRKIGRDISDLKLNGISEDNIIRCRDFVDVILKTGISFIL